MNHRRPWLASVLLTAVWFVPLPAVAQPAGHADSGTEGPGEEKAVADVSSDGESATPLATDEDDGDLGSGMTGDGTTEAEAEPGWRAAATPAQQQRARRLFQEGNQLVKESLFVQAVEKYEAALVEWNHPGIHYNLALALINLDQPVRLRTHLVQSLEFGDAALGRDKARRARQYIALVEKQLTEVVIHCEQPGARVELDGEFLFVAPGEVKRFVRPGQHTIKAVRAGFETTERLLSLVAGQRTDVPVRLYKPEDWIQTERRWRAWGPIAVTASGAAVLGLGATLYAVGSEEVRSFDAKVEARCGDGGCAPGEIDDNPDRGENLQGVGIGAIAVGGATLVAGGVLLYLNRPIPHRVDPEAGDKLTLTPIVAPGVAGLVGRGVF